MPKFNKYFFHSHFFPLLSYFLVCLVSGACNNTAPKGKPVLASHMNDMNSSLLDEHLAETLKTLDSFAQTRDVYTERDLYIKMREIKQETAQTDAYLQKWQERLVRASGGRNSDGMPKNPQDTMAVYKLLIAGRGGDTVKRFIDETQGTLAGQTKDSAAFCSLLMLQAEQEHIDGNWTKSRFQHANLADATETFERFRYELKSSELVTLNRVLKDAQAKKKGGG